MSKEKSGCTKRIIELRNEQKLTQTEMAEKLEIHLRTYSRYENDEIVWKHNMLKKIANEFGVSITYLLYGGDKAVPDLSEADRQIIKLFSSYNEEKKCEILEGLKMILDKK